MVELLTADDGSWTIALTIPDGPTCVIGQGQGWQHIPLVDLETEKSEAS
ncbi:MAG: hypothetical protein AAGH60_14615 [Pseudomonadota bacterium]